MRKRAIAFNARCLMRVASIESPAPESEGMKRRRGWCGEIASQDLPSGRENPDRPWFELGRARKWDGGNCHEVKCRIIREYGIQMDLHLAFVAFRLTPVARPATPVPRTFPRSSRRPVAANGKCYCTTRPAALFGMTPTGLRNSSSRLPPLPIVNAAIWPVPPTFT